MRFLVVLFFTVPLLELWLLLQVGSAIGLWPTLAMVGGTAFLGAWLAKREGLRVLRNWQHSVAQMRLPEEGLTSGLLVLVGAVLLVTPGILTDVLGIALLVPQTRRSVARALENWLAARFQRGSSVFHVRVVTPAGPSHPGGPVIDVEGRRHPGGAVLDVEGRSVDDHERRDDVAPHSSPHQLPADPGKT